MTGSTRSNRLLASALWYARAGFSVFPCKPRGKEPLTPHGCKDASTDEATIRSWWMRWADANVALAVPAGFVVVDLDGPEAAQALHAEDYSLPATAVAVTAKGEHHWYTLPEGVRLKNAVRVLPGVDLRTFGGYVIAPPSIHPTGVVYRWHVKPEAFAEAPAWLLDLNEHQAGEKPGAKPPEWWRKLVADGVGEGQRNHTLARLAGHLLRRRVDAFVALELVACWNRERCRPPLSADEVARTVDSVAAAELRRRRGDS